MIIKVKFQGKMLKFYLGRRSDFAAFYQVFVEKSYPNLIAKLRKGNVAIDAGANIGVFTVIASTLVGPECKVISIEPDPENVKALKKNVELNELKTSKSLREPYTKNLEVRLNSFKMEPCQEL